MTDFLHTIPNYRCHEQVKTLKIRTIILNPRSYELHFEDERFVPIVFSAHWVSRLHPEAGGYVVWHDSHIGYSPAAAFEAGYTLMEEAP